MLLSMTFKCQILDFFIIFIIISISFAIDGSLPKGPYEKTVYLKAKGQSRPVNLHDVRTKKLWPTKENSGRSSEPSPSKNEEDGLDMYADYDLNYDPGIQEKSVKKTLFNEVKPKLSTSPFNKKNTPMGHSKDQLSNTYISQVYSKESPTNKYSIESYYKHNPSPSTKESRKIEVLEESRHGLTKLFEINQDGNRQISRTHTKQESSSGKPRNVHATTEVFEDQSVNSYNNVEHSKGQTQSTNKVNGYSRDKKTYTHPSTEYSIEQERHAKITEEYPKMQKRDALLIQNDYGGQTTDSQTSNRIKKEYSKEQTTSSTNIYLEKDDSTNAKSGSISFTRPITNEEINKRNISTENLSSTPKIQTEYRNEPFNLKQTSLDHETNLHANTRPNIYDNTFPSSPIAKGNTNTLPYPSISPTNDAGETQKPHSNTLSGDTRKPFATDNVEYSITDMLSPSSSATIKLESLTKAPTNLPISSQYSSVLSKTRSQSPKRIEIPEGERVDVIWLCPPTDDRRSIPPAQYEWYMVSKIGTYGVPLSSTVDVATNRSVLEIKGANAEHANRYFCLVRKGNPFTSMPIYFYQIIILFSKWVNIGSVGVVAFHTNQKVILNCPYGDIIKNNVSHTGSCCSSRIAIKESRNHTDTDIYRCSNSDKITIKMPVKNSSDNCSLSLSGCIDTTKGNETGKRKLDEKIIIESLPKCNFNNDRKPLINHSIQKQCPGKIFIRFYFDNARQRCFPFETSFCGEDGLSFDSFEKCEEACVTINPDLRLCFYPLNTDIAHTCSKLELKGTYMVTYNIESSQCQWFYHCGDFPLTKNVFKSISKCNKVCVHNEKAIRLESFKACDSPVVENASSPGIQEQRWSFHKETQRCELINEPPNTNLNYIYFISKKKCETICGRIDEEICRSRPENGICSSPSIKWYFSVHRKRCIRILDGNCGTSLNRFHSKASCEEICSRFLYRTTKTFQKSTTTWTQAVLDVSTPMSTSTQINVTPKVSVRKRFHRRVSNLNLKSSREPSSLAPERTTPTKYFSPIDSEIDFDPCFKDSTKGSCDYGFGRHTYQMIRYSFKPQTGRCYKIKFTGCKSGENLFDDANDCKSACEFRLHRSLKSPSCQNPYSEKCIAISDVKTQERLKRYFYLPLTGECVPFTSVDTVHCVNQYFTSVEQCKQVCTPKPPMEHMLQNRCFGKIVLSDHSCSADEKIYLWFFLSIINQCLQYWTCPVEVEGNAFYTKVDCEDACKTSNIHAVCNLPVDNGRGYASKRRYFHDSQMGKCRLFYYKGSLGNLNRFKTKKECEGACLETHGNTDIFKHSSLISNPIHQKLYEGTSTDEIWLNEISDKEYCYDSHRYGGCSPDNAQVFIKKYYYDAYRKQCEPYMFSGCGSISKNSFDSMNICDKMCTERIAKTTSSLCSQKVSKCSESQWVYWMYNAERGSCEPFSSCIKKSDDQFFFTREQHCTQLCAPPLPLKKDHFDICHLPPSMNKNCSKLSEIWHFDDPNRSCFSALGCQQYGNNFPSKSSCLAACEPQQLKDVCQLPVDKGPCNDNDTLKYYFDWKSQTCKTFPYGGCLGNRNRFRTETECEQICSSKNACNIRFNNTRCTNSIKHSVSHLYYYDIRSEQCQPVRGFTCGDHTKFFSSKDKCDGLCTVPVDFQSIIYKAKPNLAGTKHVRCLEFLKFDHHPVCSNSDEWLPRFFYDVHHDQCTFFYYNGCNGTQDHGNRFSQLSQCEDACRTTKSTAGPNSVISLNGQTTPRHSLKKSGFCPEPDNSCSRVQEQFVRCEIDKDCPGPGKCCFCDMDKSTMSLCMEPLSCMATKYGCCSDGRSLATDMFHTNCIIQAAHISPTLEEVIRMEPYEDLILNCQVTGDPKPNITWVYFGNTTQSFIVESKWDLIHPVWSGVIKIPSAQHSQGLWSCQTVNAGGWDEKEVLVHSSTFNVGFLKLLSFGKEEGSVINVTLNTKVVLHCPIYGLPRPTFIWFYDRISVNDSYQSISVFGRYLQINSVKFMHDGIWTCNGANKLKHTSYSIKLRIHNPLKIFPPPMGTRIKANLGQKILLFCDVRIEGNRWINWILEMDRKSTKLNSTFNNDPRILLISSFRNRRSSSYVCEAHNEASEDRIKFTIVPYNEDDIVVHPSGALFVGMTITLACPIRSLEKITNVQWKKQDSLLDKSSPELVIMLKSKHDSGFYSCQHSGRSYLTYLFVIDKLMDL